MGGTFSTEATAASATEANNKSSETKASTKPSILLQCPRCSTLFGTDPSSPNNRFLPITCKYCFDCTQCARCTDRDNGLCLACKRRGLDSSVPNVHHCAALLNLKNKKEAPSSDRLKTKYQVGMRVQAVSSLHLSVGFYGAPCSVFFVKKLNYEYHFLFCGIRNTTSYFQWYRTGVITAVRRVKRYCIAYSDGYEEELNRVDLMQDTVVLEDTPNRRNPAPPSRKRSRSITSPAPSVQEYDNNNNDNDSGDGKEEREEKVLKRGPDWSSPQSIQRRVGSKEGTDGSNVWKAKLRILVPTPYDCPKKLVGVFRLMDQLFETGTAIEDSLRSSGGRGAGRTPQHIRRIAKKFPDHWALQWYGRYRRYVPWMVDDLEVLIEFLLEYYLRSRPLQRTFPVVLVPMLGADASNPDSTDPFDEMIPNDLCVPRTFRGILAAMNELWGEEDGFDYGFNQTRTAALLWKCQQDNPDEPALSWHPTGQEFAPPDKETCRLFMAYVRQKLPTAL